MKKKVTNKLFQVRGLIEEKLQSYCASLSPKKRLVSILVLCSIFGVVSLYFSFSAIYSINKTDREQIKIEHINQLKLHSNDSIHQQNLKQYERNE
ncbi:MAG: TraL conjugative transposon family protein [Paludibacter sp.]|jgi:Conjugative transposon protein TraL